MKLPVLKYRKLCRFLEKEGFVPIRQSGGHRFFKHPDGRTTVVPIHSRKPISRGLLKGILSEIQMSRKEFFRKFK